MLPDAARDYYDAQQRLTNATLALTRAAWSDMTGVSTWAKVKPRVQLVALSAQLGAARAAEPYLTAVLPELDIDDEPVARVAPTAFVGVAGDGRSVDGLLDGAVAQRNMAQGGRWLEMAVHTLVADTARTAVSVGITARPKVTGYVRMLNLPSCSRCAILAGRWYRWSSGFPRHPRCDCRHIPATEDVAGDLTTDPQAAYRAGKVRGLTESQRKALDEGADMARVVNSRRGMDSAGSVTTREAAGKVQRLSPEGVYRQAGDNRDEAIRLLRANGYLT